MTDDKVPGTIIPLKFLPMIGYVTVRHSQMDTTINIIIGHLAEMEHAQATAVTSAVMNTKTRLDVLRKLILVAVSGPNNQDKLMAVKLKAEELSAERNRLIHDQPYYYGPSPETVGLARAENLTVPQIKKQSFTEISEQSLQTLGDEMFKITIWLGMFLPTFPDCPHPDWNDDAQFPWPDILQKQRDKRRQAQG